MRVLDFEQAQVDREIERRLHHDEFVRHHPEYLIPKRYSARVGKHPTYDTSHDAVQYERGYSEWPNQPPGLPTSPRMEGYRDAEVMHQAALTHERRVVVA